jgi:prepilin-type processing-associated H-X9-DG protein
MKTTCRQKAFTLTELLVVTATVAMLAAASLPSGGLLSQPRAQDLACLNNKRQLSAAWLMYASDNSSQLATAFEWVNFELYPDLSFSVNNTANTNLAALMEGQLGPYLKGPAAYRCPEDRSLAREGTALLPRVRSVSMSQAIVTPSELGYSWIGSPPWYTYYRTTQILRPAPAGLFVFIDENPDSINDAAFAVDMFSSGASAAFQDGPSILHQGGCAFGFADGHAELHQWQDPRTLKNNATHYANYDYPFGLVVPNDRDVAWLEFRTSANMGGTPGW